MAACNLGSRACPVGSDAFAPVGAFTRVQPPLCIPTPTAIHMPTTIAGTIRVTHPGMRAPQGTSRHRVVGHTQRIICRASGDPTMDLTINEERWKKQVECLVDSGLIGVAVVNIHNHTHLLTLFIDIGS